VSDALEEDGLREVLQSGKWYRYAAGEKGKVAEFERQWAADVGVPYCQATNSGTSSLVCALAALQIGPGDEVLVPPYTFIATVNAVLVHHALPVFADTDPDTAQMDPGSLESRINENTRAILPVHIAGAPCDMDRILAIAKTHGLHVVEDACQAHTAAWNGKRVGSLGDAGCFSFQNSKNITSGDGGALTTNDRMIYARAQAFQNNGSSPVKDDGAKTSNGMNLRLTEFQGALLLAQMTRNAELTRRREENGAYLNDLLNAVPGVRAKRTYPGTTRHGYHLYMFDFDPEQFAGMSKSLFLKALAAEGVPASGGYTALNKQPFVEQFLAAPGFQRIYSAQRLKDYREQNECPANDRMIERTCWLTQNILLGSRQDMDSIAEAVSRIQKHAGDLVQSAS
jgi:dTDP-4-amino-4,6-dideoxygalactose transaminase